MKKQLRKEVLAARMAQTDEEIVEKSAYITKRLVELPEFQNAGLIMFYLDFRKEVSTGDLIIKCLKNGQRVVVPITDTKNVRLIPSELKNYPGDLASGTWGILEPKPECVRPVDLIEIDFVVVPGVSFDTKGNRLGYGGGFYDRFLRQLRPDSSFAALAFELQIRDNVYPEEHDYPMKYVITENRLIKC
ncbi:5-formyltetrahydrofolate cyclo-ligase [Phosphitispora sp. TUW77]|uniref:5-formyltetrahydrofolate cyclo-ligase n=1 Tax=Phosphitispora sp. TUW77 TaxID=3152361 RepID=UPI003AB38CD3